MPLDREISPPPTKRRRLSPSPTSSHEPSPALQPNPPPTHLRIFSWNINGINPLLQPPLPTFFNPTSPATSTTTSNTPPAAPKSPLRAFLARHAYPQILCLQEVKISRKDTTTQHSVERAANPSKHPTTTTEADKGRRYVVKFCLPRDKYNAKGFGGKVYGVATLIREDFHREWVEGIREVDWDLEGRVLVAELKGGVRVFNIYAVNGTENVYRCPETGVVVGTRHDRKRRFHEELLEECMGIEREGGTVVLVGDMNIARDERDGFPNLRLGEEHVKNRKDFNGKFFGDGEEGLGAVDVFRYLHGDERKFTYYPRAGIFGESCDRVDLVIVSRALVDAEAVVGADILNTPLERGHSDHVPLSVTLDMERVRRGLKVGGNCGPVKKGDS
ncbi:MAG: hypothetical protein M1835_000381 [Candelina submexicana]|nr:MAG: hypothetical protein M1835_000381 [Candelina submexicana]